MVLRLSRMGNANRSRSLHRMRPRHPANHGGERVSDKFILLIINNLSILEAQRDQKNIYKDYLYIVDQKNAHLSEERNFHFRTSFRQLRIPLPHNSIESLLNMLQRCLVIMPEFRRFHY